MVSLQIIAAFLLLARAGSDIFIGIVLKKQWRLLRSPIKNSHRFPESYVRKLRRFRIVLFSLSVVIFFSNIVPIVIDLISVLGYSQGRPGSLRLISVLYAFSNALGSLFSAYLINTLYRLAAQEDDITEYTTQHINDVTGKKD